MTGRSCVAPEKGQQRGYTLGIRRRNTDHPTTRNGTCTIYSKVVYLLRYIPGKTNTKISFTHIFSLPGLVNQNQCQIPTLLAGKAKVNKMPDKLYQRISC